MKSSNLIESRIEKGPFGFSFLSWQGNNVSFEDSAALSWTLIISTFLILVLFVFIKDYLHRFYWKNEKKIVISLQVYSFIIIALSIFRMIILGYGKYPNTWEIVPFHFCRMFIIIVSFLILFRKFEWLKYIIFTSLCGAIVGLLITDLKTNDYWNEKGGIKIGYDCYSFWDFYFIHISSALISQFLLMGRRFKISKWTVTITTVSLISFTTFLFILDWAFSLLDNKSWNSNWYYIAPDHINGIDDTLSKFLGPIAKWPMIFFLFIFIGITLYSSSLAIYFFVDKFEINFKSKPIFKKRESELWNFFLNKPII